MNNATTSRNISVDNVFNTPVYAVTGPDGAVTFRVAPALVGYHSRIPNAGLFEPDGPCEHIDGDPCWSDGSGLQGQALLGRWVAAGRDDAVVWAELEKRYQRHFVNKV